MYLVYILQSGNHSYIGMTNDFFKRWKQHNKILKGGAKYTSKYDNWSPICIIDGFQTKSEAMQCEWKLKHNKKYKGPTKRILYSFFMIQKDKWTSNSPTIKTQDLTVYIDDDYSYIYKNYPTKQLYWK